jgi:translocation and assembly module TamA
VPTVVIYFQLSVVRPGIVKKILSFCLVFLLCCTIATGQEPARVDVVVTGLDGAPLNNVLSRLSLFQQRDNPRLTEVMVRRLFADAHREITAALEPYGYYSPAVEKDLAREVEAWKATFHVTPGEPVRITEIGITLSGAGRHEQLLLEGVARYPLRVGDVLDHRLYEQGKKNLTSTALSAGYREVAFNRHMIEVDPGRHSAVISLELDTGPRYLFGPTTFEADFLSHHFLSRILPYKEGEPFSPRALVQLRQSLLGSDYFSQVDVRTGTVAEASLKVPIIITLSPKKRNLYGFGVGYGTDTGTRGSVEWTNRLLNRYGHQFTLRFQPSERKSHFGGVYTIPVRDPRKDRLSLLAKWEKEDFENTELEQRMVSVAYDHIREVGEYSTYLSYLDEDYDTGLESGHAILLMPGIKTTWRLADDRLRTQRGIRVTLDLTGATEELVSDGSFVQASVSSKAILALFDQWRLIGQAQLGGTIVDTVFDLPPSLRFYAGGDQSVRGYAYKSIGPVDQFGNVLGGRYLVTYSVELERKLFDNWSGALFFDSGDAPDSLDDLAMKNGAGIGLRWNAPFGQVRLDVANPVSEGERAWRIHFNVGADL